MNWKTKDIFRVLAVVTLFLLFILFLYKILYVIGWLFAALLITILLSPLVDWVQKKIPRKKRGLAVFLTFLIVLLILGVLGVIIFTPLVKEFGSLRNQVQGYVEQAKNSSEFNGFLEQIERQTGQTNIGNNIKDALGSVTKSLGTLISGISNGVFVLITITTLAFFMLLDTQSALNIFGQVVPQKYKNVYNTLNKDLFSLVSKYFTGVIIVATIAGAAAAIPLFLLGSPYVLAMAATIAIFDLVPMIGATLGTIIIDIILVLSGNIPAAIIMTLYIIVYQQIENNVVIPLVQKRTVEMRPLSILIALLIGGAIGGIIGTLLAIPAIAFIKIVFETLKREGLLGEAVQKV